MRIFKGLISALAVLLFYTASLVALTWLTNGGLVGRELSRARTRLPYGLMVPVANAQESDLPVTLVPVPRVGSKWQATGPDGQLHTYTIGDTSHAQITLPDEGFVICPNGHPVTSNVNVMDVQEATVCRDGRPLGARCTAGTVTYLCCPPGATRCTPGQKQEVLTPAQAELFAARDRRQPLPQPTVTRPHM